MKEQRISKRLLSIVETAEYLGRTPGAVRELIYKGKLPKVKLDTRIFVDIRDLDAIIEQSKETSTI